MIVIVAGHKKTIALAAITIVPDTKTHGLKTKIIFINDGPGLLIGSMWEDYSRLEDLNPKKIKVMTLRMIEERLSLDWLTEG